ncbi:hypothetical protein ACFQVC_09215 [Streptomyces monticola]|uniref:Uncharacterized protein n=1 Tax=Streptomyces monticola TaxID=2666263 RepID=A0ABW2JGH6_9ACTN
MIGPGNGQWVRTRTEADAKNFLAEKQMEQERAQRPGAGTAIAGFLVLAALAAWLIWAIVS